jgi:hypothetical protein
MDWIYVAQKRDLIVGIGFYECGNESLGSIKDRVFLD